MNPELREAVGKAIYEQEKQRLEDLDLGTVLPWDELLEDTREHYLACGEKAAEAFIGPFLPGITILGQELIKNNPSMHDMINEVFRQATGRDLE